MTALLRVRNLSKSFDRKPFLRKRKGPEKMAVDDVSFTLHRGRIMALVGESGAGKSTVGRLVLRLIEPDSGAVNFDDEDLLKLPPRRMREIRRRMQMVFQDPYGSLDPRFTILDAVTEPLVVHETVPQDRREDVAREALSSVGLTSNFLQRYPSELSGGQLQRVAIARALTLSPELLVCDEPTAALDVSVQAQVLAILAEVQQRTDMSMLFITHDLALVDAFCDDIIVMSKGKVVESGTVEKVLYEPTDPYTRQLIASVPLPMPKELRGE